MQLEFHQLELRWEHLRVRHPARQRRLLASLAESGQQAPIVVVAGEDQAGRYIVIDGYTVYLAAICYRAAPAARCTHRRRLSKAARSHTPAHTHSPRVQVQNAVHFREVRYTITITASAACTPA
jgi:hypothetical protein